MRRQSMAAIAAVGLLLISFQNCAKNNFDVEQISLDGAAKPEGIDASGSPAGGGTGTLPPEFVCRTVDAPEVKPVLKWQWDHAISRFPDFNQVMSNPVVGDLNKDGIPEIVFVSFMRPGDASKYPQPAITTTVNGVSSPVAAYNQGGVLHILDGKTGAEKFTLMNNELAPHGTTTPTLVDLDGDGKVEILYVYYQGTAIIALNADGSFRWKAVLPAPVGLASVGVSAADLDGDGRSEILALPYVIKEDAFKRPVIAKTFTGLSGSSFAASLDPALPREMQIVTKFGVLRPDGSYKVKFTAPASNNPIVADLRPEIPGLEIAYYQIVSNTEEYLYLVNGVTGETIFKVLLNGLGIPGAPGTGRIGGGTLNAGDFRGDGVLGIGTAGASAYFIIDAHGKLVAQSPTRDYSSLATGSSLFDFNGDGKMEILYGDERYFRVYSLDENSNLQTIFRIPNMSGTLLEYPMVVDIDGDQSSEILVVSNNYAGISFGGSTAEENASIYSGGYEKGFSAWPGERGGTGLRAFRAASSQAWVPTRSLWNQHLYFVENVTDSLMATSKTSSTFTSFRRNVQGNLEKVCR